MRRAEIGRALSVGVMSVVLIGAVALLVHRTLDRARCDGALQCLHLAGEAWSGREGVEPDLDLAATLLLRACEEGASDGCTQFWSLTSSQAFEKLCNTDDPAACALPLAEAERVARLCEEGSDEGCFELALMDVHAHLKVSDPDRGDARFDSLCARDHAEACWMLTLRAWYRPDREALREKACALGAPRACDDLAMSLYYSTPQPTITPRVIDLYDRACALGAPEGCLHIAELLLDPGEAADTSRGLRAMRRACDLSPPFCLNLHIACHHHPDDPACPPAPPLNCASPRDCVEQGEAAERAQPSRRNPAQAARLYGAACDAGLAEGCEARWFILLGALNDPEAAQRARSRTIEALDRNCADGDAGACLHLGELHQRHDAEVAPADDAPPGEGRPNPVNPSVEASFSRACALDLARGCAALGALLAEGGRGAEADAPLKKASALFERACDVGDAESCLALVSALELAGEGASKVHGKLEVALIPICEGEDRERGQEACQRLAGLYLTGRRPDPGAAKVEALMQRRCDEGLWGDGVSACQELAGLLWEGRMVGKDLPRAAKLYRQVCNEGHVGACHALNRICSGDADLDGCFEVERVDCKGAAACFDAGLNHFEGTTVHRNVGQAVWLFRQACQQGSGPSCAFLARGLEAGEFLDKDLDSAADLHARACSLGETWSCPAPR